MFLTTRDLKDYAKSKMANLEIDGNKIEGLRPAQEEILAKFVEALNQDRHMFIQAPNGCGKTLAYSLVASYIIEKKNGEVLIICPTKDLQKQVSTTCYALNLDFIELYGSGEYTCPLRNELLKGNGNLGKNAPVITLFCKHLEKCPYLEDDKCDYFKLQKLAKEFPLVITNYNKYLSSWDMLSDGRKFDLTIFDEAHNLESIAEQSSLVHISSQEVKNAKEYFQKFLKENHKKVEELIPTLRDYFPHMEFNLQDVVKTIGHFEGLIRLFEGNQFNSMLDTELSEKDLEQFVNKCKNLINVLELFSIMEILFVPRPENMFIIKFRVKLINFTIAASKLRNKYLFRGRSKGGYPEIVGEPQIRGMIQYILEKSTEIQCHVSATLGNLFDYAERIGAFKRGFLECNITDYPFDPKRRILLGLTDGPPMRKYEKSEKEYSWKEKKKIANRILEKLLLKWPGNTLIFFRSRDEAAEAHEFLLKNRLLEPRLIFKKYFETGKERKELIEHFKKKKGSILFGFGKMDQGIDLPGESLTLVLVYSMPFIHRTTQMWKDFSYFHDRYGTSGAYEKVDLAVAAKRLSQLIGRLIRAKNDFGIVVVIDRRFYTRFYNWMRGRKMLPQDVNFELVNTNYACEKLEKFWKSTIGESYLEYIDMEEGIIESLKNLHAVPASAQRNDQI